MIKDCIRAEYYGTNGVIDDNWHGTTLKKIGYVELMSIWKPPRPELDYTFAKIRKISGVNCIDWQYVIKPSGIMVIVYSDIDPHLVNETCRQAFVDYTDIRCPLVKI